MMKVQIKNRGAMDQYEAILSNLNKHEELFSRVIPLIASENVTSPAMRRALTSDFGHRYAEGWPTERVYAGCAYIDQVELICSELGREVFDAEFIDVRPISGVVANLIMYTAFTKPGERIMALSTPCGGHISHGRTVNHGTAGAVHGLKVQYWEFDSDNYNINVDRTASKIRRLEERGKHINLYLFGGSLYLFPSPVKELSDIAREYGAKVGYDAAHVAGLIAAGFFQDPLREGADCMTLSTHKTFFGPQRGLIASFEEHAEELKRAAFPAMLSSHHLNTMAAMAIALCEYKEYGETYARQTLANAKVFAEALHEKGFNVVCEERGFTESHQVAVNVVDTPLGEGSAVEKALEAADIMVNRNLLPGDVKAGRHYVHPGGIRLGTQEVTRLGMKEDEMDQIAEFMKKVVLDGDNPSRVRQEVNEFRGDYQRVHFCFDE
jgi:glycine hydroxymethyltransferase